MIAQLAAGHLVGSSPEGRRERLPFNQDLLHMTGNKF